MHSHKLEINPLKIHRSGGRFVEASLLDISVPPNYILHIIHRGCVEENSRTAANANFNQCRHLHKDHIYDLSQTVVAVMDCWKIRHATMSWLMLGLSVLKKKKHTFHYKWLTAAHTDRTGQDFLNNSRHCCCHSPEVSFTDSSSCISVFSLNRYIDGAVNGELHLPLLQLIGGPCSQDYALDWER